MKIENGLNVQCQHLNIGMFDSLKPSCIECGLVQEVYQTPYVRSITHYRNLFKDGRNPPIHCIKNPILQNQICKFHMRIHAAQCDAPKNKHSNIENDDKDVHTFYSQYIQFLYNNENLILPNKTRIRPIRKIYGDHRQFILKWISAFLNRSLV